MFTSVPPGSPSMWLVSRTRSDGAFKAGLSVGAATVLSAGGARVRAVTSRKTFGDLRDVAEADDVAVNPFLDLLLAVAFVDARMRELVPMSRP